ncbi:MAG: hypothetical protein IJ865_07080, partial [Clostridia bacterium]|nr:hypothetical protein [Clostridia bacterium]
KTVAEVDAEQAAEKEGELKERQAMKKPKSTVLKNGANLWTVAQQFTGSGGNWQDILAYNAGSLMSADDATEGMRIKLP